MSLAPDDDACWLDPFHAGVCDKNYVATPLNPLASLYKAWRGHLSRIREQVFSWVHKRECQSDDERCENADANAEYGT